jgi:hypothetical protein
MVYSLRQQNMSFQVEQENAFHHHSPQQYAEHHSPLLQSERNVAAVAVRAAVESLLRLLLGAVAAAESVDKRQDM